MAEVKDQCGVVGVYLKNNKLRKTLVPELISEMLSQLQHRGQLSAGISTYNPYNRGYERRLKLLREVGGLDALFRTNHKGENSRVVEYCRGTSGIGHVRYATAGSAAHYLDLIEETQPFLRHHGRPWKRFSIAFNGNLANYDELRREMRREGYLLDTKVDTELIMHLLALNLKTLSRKNKKKRDIKPDLFEVIKEVIKQLDGAYSVVALFGDGDLVAFRDPFGFKPFVWGETSEYFAIASESVALEQAGIDNFYPVKEGACMIFNKKGVLEGVVAEENRKAHCHFERVYFSDAASFIDGKSVNSTRENLGKNLAKIEPLKNQFPGNFVVVPVPYTAIPAAQVFAEELSLPFNLAITVPRRSQRGFINRPGKRSRIMHRKYRVIRERVEGKKVILLEDSVVRGETSKRIINLLKKAGALEVHLRSTEPPIMHPCFYGIDFPTYTELIAFKHSSAEDLQREVAGDIGADSVVYQTLDGLIEATGFSRDELCLSCVNSEYVTDAGKIRSRNLLGGN